MNITSLILVCLFVSPLAAQAADDSQGSDAGGPQILDGFLPSGSGPGTTGTNLPEIFKYQLPTNYDPLGPPIPIVVAYHGFGSSANSVSSWSMIDEEAELRGWAYMAPTGLDDKLFGSPISQQHSEAAIGWMLEQFQIDPDRIYMVGFSMGGGVTANFASRRRDPGGIMIAAMGIVSSDLDWTQSWTLGDQALQGWLENSYNFEGTPAQKPFNYQQASALYFDETSYPPLPGSLVPSLSMASNLQWVPTYLTYHVDSPPPVPGAMDALEALLVSLGTPTQTTIQTYPGPPGPMTWDVLDEVELFDFFDGKLATRLPANFSALQDLGGPVSWAATTQRSLGAFTRIEGDADPLSGSLTVTAVSNATDVVVDAGLAGLSGLWPLRVTASSADADGFRLRLTGFDQAPSYLLDATTGELVTLVDSDPATGSLSVDVGPGVTLSVDVVSDPNWTGSLVTSPNPAGLQSLVSVAIDLAPSSPSGWLIIATDEALYPAKGVLLTALVTPPAIVVPLTLDGNGDAQFDTVIPNDAALLGLRLPTQAVGLDAAGLGESVTNLWGLRIE